MAIYSNSYGYLFVMNPRTGCTATGRILIDELEGRFCPENDILDESGKIIVGKKHSTVEELLAHEVLNEERLRNTLVFTTVRNPFDSLYSLWAKKRVDYVHLLEKPNSWVNKVPDYRKDMDFIANHSFSDWIRKKYRGRPQQFSLGLKFAARAQFVMRFETLQQDFERVLKLLGVEREIIIPEMNKTKGREGDYREHYDENARKIVEKVFHRELQYFGYVF